MGTFSVSASYYAVADYKSTNPPCNNFVGPRTLCNACGLVYAKLVGLFSPVSHMGTIIHHTCCV